MDTPTVVAIGVVTGVVTVSGAKIVKEIHKLYRDMRHDYIVLTRFLRDEIRKGK